MSHLLSTLIEQISLFVINPETDRASPPSSVFECIMKDLTMVSIVGIEYFKLSTELTDFAHLFKTPLLALRKEHLQW